jgi:PhnB protein
MAVKPIPAGYHVLTATCAMKGCAQAIETYRKVFGAEVSQRFDMPDGTVAHCELRFGDSTLMIGEAGPQTPAHGTHLMIYVPDCDVTFKRATDAGFRVIAPLSNQFYGDRNGRVSDPFGNTWYISTHVEDVSVDEMKKRMAKRSAG